MKIKLSTTRLGCSFLAAILATMLAGCNTPGPHSVSAIDLPTDPDGAASVPNPNHSGPHQIDLSVVLPPRSSKTFCVSPDPDKKPRVFVVNKDGKSYLVVEGVACTK